MKYVNRITKCFGYISHIHVIKKQTPRDSDIIVFIIEIFFSAIEIHHFFISSPFLTLAPKTV